MEEEKHQKELFEFDRPKRSFSRLAAMLPRADFEGRVSITISLEKLVFISIGMVMVVVVVYALGVDSGRARAKAAAVQTVKTPAVPMMKPPVVLSASQVRQNTAAAIPARNILNTAPIVPAAKPALGAKQAAHVQQKAVPAGGASKPFTILAGAFSKLENAQAAAAILTRQGFNAAVTYSAPYYRVCAGSYSDKTGAETQNDLAKVRRIYKDAMLKLR